MWLLNVSIHSHCVIVFTFSLHVPSELKRVDYALMHE